MSIAQTAAMSSSNDNAYENQCATKIQALFRGYRVRKGYLPSHLFPMYKKLCNEFERVKLTAVRALDGRTPVYLPIEVPEIVIKCENKKSRFHQMQEVRNVLESIGVSTLVVPRAAGCDRFLIEERLPVAPNLYTNMGRYALEPYLFDTVVRESVKMYSHLFLEDLLLTPERHREGVWYDMTGINNSVRYDNFPFYIEEKEGKRIGKIGLIDLEQSKLSSDKENALPLLARIFPYHLGVILDEAQKLDWRIESKDIVKAQNEAEEGARSLESGFLSHYRWLKANGVSGEDNKKDSFDFLYFTTAAKETIFQELESLNNSTIKIPFSGTYPVKITEDRETVNLFAEEFAGYLISFIGLSIEEHYAKNHQKQCEESDLVDLRTIISMKGVGVGLDIEECFMSNSKLLDFKEYSTGLVKDEVLVEVLTRVFNKVTDLLIEKRAIHSIDISIEGRSSFRISY